MVSFQIAADHTDEALCGMVAARGQGIITQPGVTMNSYSLLFQFSGCILTGTSGSKPQNFAHYNVKPISFPPTKPKNAIARF